MDNEHEFKIRKIKQDILASILQQVGLKDVEVDDDLICFDYKGQYIRITPDCCRRLTVEITRMIDSGRDI